MFSGRFIFILLLCIASFAGANRPVFAQGADKKPAAPSGGNKETSAKLVSSNWNLDCHPAGPEQKLVCEVSKKIALETTRKILLTVFVTPRNAGKGADAYVLRFLLPHGLNLTAGVKMQIDKNEAQTPAGVFARLAMNARLLETLKKGTVMTVSFSALNGTGLSIPVSLAGFGAVYAKLK